MNRHSRDRIIRRLDLWVCIYAAGPLMCVLAAIVSILTRSDKLGPLISVMIGVGTIASVAGAIGLPLFAYRKVATINRWLLFFVLLLAAPILIFLTSMLLLGLVAGSG